MERIYKEVIRRHLLKFRQMVFLMGPRQVGKTTTSLQVAEKWTKHKYFNWDNPVERLLFVGGLSVIAEQAVGADLLILDEIQGFKNWKEFLEKLKVDSRMLIIGNGCLNKPFYRIHPLSAAEIITPSVQKSLIRPPSPISQEDWTALIDFGGFPEPFLQRSSAFHRQWVSAHQQCFLRDIRDCTRIQEIAQLELLAELLRRQAAQSMDYQSLAKKVGISVDTARRWIEVLKSFYYCFALQPWSKNISRSLIKEPKLYLWDWSQIENEGARHENLVASHLLKAVHFWSDCGLGDFGLYYLRTKDKLETDFAVTKDGKPWFLVEVKTKANGMSRALYHFQEETGAPHAFQVAFDLPYVHKNCFDEKSSILVPATTFLSQLV